MRRSCFRRAPFGPLTIVLAVAVVVFLFGVPVPARANTASSASPTQPASAYEVTWNGVDVASASSPSSALSIDLAQTASLVYRWTVTSPVTVTDARLQMFYFGYAVSTRDEQETQPVANLNGSIPLSWAPLSIDYLLEGVYKLTATFFGLNGTTLWSESFYVRGTAPYGVVALIPIVLLILIVYEVYALVTSGRYVSLGRPPAAPPPAAPPAATPPVSTPPTGPSAPSGPSEGGTPPPSGGSS